MEISAERVADLEWANYAAMLSSARVTPGLEVTLREDAIITSSTALPTPDSNHACLLRATAQKIDDLVGKLTRRFRERGLPIALYISPACRPSDLPHRLLEMGFKKQPQEETWMVLEDLANFDIPSPYPEITVRPINKHEVTTFTEVFSAAFDMPQDLAPIMAQLLRPSVDLASIRHYLAYQNGQPIGTCSLLRYKGFGILGSAGVALKHRGRGAATNLAVRAARDARARGVDTLMLQTSADTWLERFLRISGFKRAFTRSCYTLDNDFAG